MGNLVVAYVQCKNHFTEQPSVGASRARAATRSVPVVEQRRPSVTARHHRILTASASDRSTVRIERTSTADAVLVTRDSASAEGKPQVLEDAAALSSSASQEQPRETAVNATDAAHSGVSDVFCYTIPGRGGWGDSSHDTWQRDSPDSGPKADPRRAGGQRGGQRHGASVTLPSWERREQPASPLPHHAPQPNTRSSERSASACTDSDESGAQHFNRWTGSDDGEEREVDEAELALLGTMDCADAHAYFYPADAVYESSDSAVLRHPETAWLHDARDLATAYVFGDGKHRVQSASPPSSSPSSSMARCSQACAFVGVAEALRRRAERQPDALALSWRHVERAVRTSATDVCLYMSVPQHMAFGALSAHIQAFRLGLLSLGLSAGDGLGLVAPSCWEWLVTCYAGWSLGLVVTVAHEDPLCVRQLGVEASRDLKCIVCASRTLPLLRRNFCARDGVRRDTAAGPRPVFVVMPDHDETNDGAEAVSVDDDRRRSSRTARAPPPTNWTWAASCAEVSPALGGADGEDDEEALWWLDLMETGRAMLYDAATRFAHQRRLWGYPYPRRLTYSRCARLRPTDLALIVYTEGNCRGVRLTHGAVRAAVTAHAEYLQEAGLARERPTDDTAEKETREPRHGAVPDDDDDDDEDAWEEAEKARVEAEVLRRFVHSRREAEWGMHKGEEAYEEDGEGEQSSVTHSPTTPGPSRSQRGQPTSPSSPLSFAFGSPAHRVRKPHADRRGGGGGATLSRVLLAAVHGDVRSSTSEALTGFHAWWQEQQAVVRAQLSQHLGSGAGAASRSTYVVSGPLHRVRELMIVTALLVRADFTVCLGRPETLIARHNSVRPCNDVQLYKPVLLSLDPHTLERLSHSVQAAVTHRGYSAVLFAAAYQARHRALLRGLETPYLDAAVFAQTRQLLGGRCQLIISHSTALSPPVQTFVQVACGAAVVQWFTLTEACGCGFAQLPWDGQVGSIGGPMGAVEIKLRDTARVDQLWPCHLAGRAGRDEEPALWTSDAEVRGEPESRTRRGRHDPWWLHDGVLPAGELLLRGPTICCGYHAQPEHTVAALDRSGWLHTGDVVQRHHTNNLGGFRVVDRLHTRAKTASGDVVDLARVEDIYRRHSLCEGNDVCVLVHPYKDMVAALVVTSEARARTFFLSPACQGALRRLAGGASTSRERASVTEFAWSAILGDPDFNAVAAESLHQWGRQHHLPENICVRRVRLVYDDWTRLRMPTGRLRRGAISRHYALLVEELFHDAHGDVTQHAPLQ